MQRTPRVPLREAGLPSPPEPERPRVLRRVATSSIVILGLTIVVAVVLIANIDFGKGKPPPGTADMSTNEMLRELSGFKVDPVVAAAEANARKRAYEHELALERAARKRAKIAKAKARARARALARKRAFDAMKRRMRNNPTAEQNKAYAKQMSAARGWGGCWDSLETMWNHESGWNEHAENPSGAYGIPQALPGSKMSSAGPDWHDNAITQITWGLGYVAARYGNPCHAWSFWQAHHWY
jgi:hypothetical protein